ncbi:TBC1 domain family member 3K-like isoform X1 [Talpa occidentalis]|uniref:TBC1 domain family member 3K-like isoform X1 n=1 Tax=Talpa occidentalis TaxID=50954 RepID=UPI0023F7A77B|nr:TBC1 domain family member 3K-like isoform X1 [Talpa occidentalis]
MKLRSLLRKPPGDQNTVQNLRMARRADKWVQMLKHWEKYSHSSKMRCRVYKGIPPQVRGRVWALLLGVDQAMLENKGEYEQLMALGKVLSPSIAEIDEDVSVTCRDHIFFKTRYSTKQQALFNVLVTFSIYNPDSSAQGVPNWVGSWSIMMKPSVSCSPG